MKFSILSRREVCKLSYRDLPEKCAIISITDTGSEPAHLAANPQIVSILRLPFDDVDRDSPKAMTQNDADRVAQFCQIQKSAVCRLIVQCEAGISRSAGVCAAIMKWHIGSDTEVFDNTRYRPNMHCYRLVLNALERLEDEK